MRHKYPFGSRKAAKARIAEAIESCAKIKDAANKRVRQGIKKPAACTKAENL